MLKKMLAWCLGLGLIHTALADPFYCTQNNQYINVGMTIPEVLQACGKPQEVKTSKKMGTTRIMMTQMVFTIATNITRVYSGTVTPGIQSGAFNVNTGPTATAVVNVVDGKIKSISLNGTNTESISLCGGSPFGVGDDAQLSVDSCGDPSSINDTYMTVSTGQPVQIESWKYQPDNYQPPFTLIFADGVLNKIGS